MPTVPISMRKLKEILRLKYGVGLSHRQIGRSLAISPSVVSRYANRAAQLGIKQWPLPTGWDDTKLKHAFLQTQVKMKKHSLPDWATVHRELRNKCVTLQLLCGFAPIFPDICYHLTHYKPAAADIPVASDNPAHYADAIRYNARTPLQGSLLPLTRLVWA